MDRGCIVLRSGLFALLVVGTAATAQEPAQERFAFGDDIFVGISAARVSTEFGPATTGLERADGSYTLHRPTVGGYDDATVALELSMPISSWFSINFLATGVAEESGPEQWVPDPPFPPATPGDLPVPINVTLDANSESRTYVISGTIRRPLSPNTVGYARLGAAVVQSDLTLFDNQRNVFARFDSTDTRPWLALGTRYRFDGGFTLDAEFGAATEGHRMARLGIGWTF